MVGILQPISHLGVFQDGVVQRFQPDMLRNSFEVLSALKQTGNVEDYVVHFEQYAGLLKGMDQVISLGFLDNQNRREKKRTEQNDFIGNENELVSCTLRVFISKRFCNHTITAVNRYKHITV